MTSALRHPTRAHAYIVGKRKKEPTLPTLLTPKGMSVALQSDPWFAWCNISEMLHHANLGVGSVGSVG